MNKVYMIKKTSFFMFFSLFSVAASATGVFENSILFNKQVEHCSSLPDEESYDCSEKLMKTSDNELQSNYDKKLNQIKLADYEKWWMGDKSQKENMLANFSKNQGVWLDYKETYCKSAAAPLENTHGYGDALSSCFINMNKKRINEINLINILASGNS